MSLSAGEAFLERVGARVGSWWAIIIPIVLEVLPLILENCPVEGQKLADACARPTASAKRRVRMRMIAGAVSIRRDEGWGLLEAARYGRAAANALIEEAADTAEKVGSGEDTTDLVELIEELKQAA